MQNEGFSTDDFKEQKKNRWRLQGKSFYDIFAEIHPADQYPATYGMMSECIHGSWNESLDWCLRARPDGTFKPNLFSYPADVRFLAPTLHFTTPPFRQWAQRIDVYDDDTQRLLDWIELVNETIFRAFDAHFDE